MYKVLKNETEYKAAQKQLYKLVFGKENQTEKEEQEIELLKLLIQTYQEQHIKIPNPDPIEAIKFRMDQMGLMQKDIAPIFGGENRASEVLKGTRPLSLKMVVLLHKYLGIPYESLVHESPKLRLEQPKVKVLMKVKPIAEFQRAMAH